MPSKNTRIFLAAILTMVSGFLSTPTLVYAGSKERVLHSFNDKGGAYPYAPLTFDAAGNLYGTTSDGGAYGEGCGYGYGCGTAFELIPGTNGKWTEKVLHSFGRGKDGLDPVSGLIRDGTGNLYGTTTHGGAYNSGCSGIGCGVVFELTPSIDGRWTEKVLHSFGKGKDGVWPDGGLVMDSAGNVYGTTFSGGSTSSCQPYCGTVFELTPCRNGTWKERVLHSFDYLDGTGPYGNLIFDATGNLYGVALGGYSRSGCSTEGCGIVFQLTPGANGKWTEKVVHRFGLGTDGFSPSGSLALDMSGNLYGTTFSGGAYGGGTFFELARGGNGRWTEKVLHNFGSGSDGVRPTGGLIFDSTGNIYGTTNEGGVFSQYCPDYYGCGTDFELIPVGNGKWTETILYNFCSTVDCKDGFYPSAVILDGAGNLYGTTSGGGFPICAGGQPCGTVFEIER